MSIDWDVLGFGVAAVDDLIYVAHYPAADAKEPVQVIHREGGGLTGTALVAAARLGAKTAYCGVLGDDELSLYTVSEFEREGIDCSQVITRPEARPYHSFIIIDQSTAQRTILYSKEGVQKRPPQEINAHLISRTRLLFIDHITGEGGLQAIQLAHAQGIPVVGDIEEIDAPFAREFLQQIDHLILSYDFTRLVTGEKQPDRMLKALSTPERICSVVTGGENGCWYLERGGEVQHFPALKIQLVDTTGCGDVFHGAYAASIARGESIPTTIRIATITAGIKATQPGGRKGIPSLETVQKISAELFY